jgi:hypothetical protein
MHDSFGSRDSSNYKEYKRSNTVCYPLKEYTHTTARTQHNYKR